MVRSQISLRIEKEKRDKLIMLAKYHNKTYADLIRDQIDLLILNGINYEVKQKIKKIIKELKQPFLYIQTQNDKQRAKKEKEIRETIIKRLEAVFNIK